MVFGWLERGVQGKYHAQVLDANGNTIQAWDGNPVQLLPPGRYAIEARTDVLAEWKRVSQAVEVRSGHLTEVNVPALQKAGEQKGNAGFHH